MAGTVSEVTDTNFQAEVIESDVPVLVDFWAPWCGPCRMVGPVVEVIAKEKGEQLKVVNNRVVQLETDLATIGRQIAAASPDLTSTTEEPPPQNVGDLANGAGAGALATFAVMMIVLVSLRRRWRRRSGSPPAALPDDSGHRLMRLEQGMDAIAVEIERISEGQRFVTRLLSESHGGAPAAQRSGEPTTVPARDQNR